MSRTRSILRIPILMVCVALLECLPAAGSAAAEHPQARAVEAPDHARNGSITLVDPIAHTVTIRDDDGRLTTIVVTVATSMLDGARSIDISQLEPGDRVVVDWDDRTGRNLATYLEVVDDVAGSSGAQAHSADR